MLIELKYNRNAAVEYAEKWALGRNQRYYDFHRLGGDCTNFISQCIYTGSGVMNYTPTFGWFYNSLNSRSPSWTAVPYLYNFLINNKSSGPYAKKTDITGLIPGDIIQLGDENGSYYHSLFVCRTGAAPTLGNTLICTHNDDAYLRAVNTYIFARIRFIHIEGVRRWQP